MTVPDMAASDRSDNYPGEQVALTVQVAAVHILF